MRVEVEVSQTEPAPCPISVGCVIRATSPGKLTFDKNLFTSMIRTELQIGVHITKRALPKEELED